MLNFEYHNGVISFDYDLNQSYITGIYSHSSNKKKPSWFHPELWVTPDVFVNIIDTSSGYERILIYNAAEKQAYFYINHWSH